MLAPKPNESQAQWAIRFHEAMRDQIPVTSERDREMMRLWREHRGDGGLQRKAQILFGDGYVHRRDIPIFAEHATQDKDGHELVYDREVLRDILGTINGRIADTGEFPPITDGHTPDVESVTLGAPVPDVLGYAGPFRFGQIGDERPRWAIFADEWHDTTPGYDGQSGADRLRTLRRRSPEVWPADNLGDRFFDPIAALGAITPRLDMGLVRMCRSSDGRTVEKYSAPALPSSTNTYVPSAEGPKKHQGGSSMTLSREDIQQVVEALKATKEWEFLQSQMTNALRHEDQNPMPDTQAKEPKTVEITDEDQEYMRRYMAGEVDDEEFQKYMAGRRKPQQSYGRDKDGYPDDYECDEEDMEYMRRYMAGEVDDEELAAFRAKKREGTDDYGNLPDDQNAAMWSKVDEVEDGRRKDGKGYAKTRMKGNWYSRHRSESGVDPVRYAKLERENSELRKRVEKIEHGRELAERRALLQADRYELAFDLDEELQDCAPDKMTRDQFEKHRERMHRNYARIPTDDKVRVWAPDSALKQSKSDDPAQDPKVVEQAQQYCLAERKKGNDVTWAEALEHVAGQSRDHDVA